MEHIEEELCHNSVSAQQHNPGQSAEKRGRHAAEDADDKDDFCTLQPVEAVEVGERDTDQQRHNRDCDGYLEAVENGAYTAYIMQVVGTVTRNAKLDIPTVEKKVRDTNDSLAANAEANADDYDADADRQGDKILEGKWFTIKLDNKDVKCGDSDEINTSDGTGVSLLEGTSKPDPVDEDDIRRAAIQS